MVDARREPLQHLLDFQIAVYDLLLIDAVQITRLTEGKQMLGPPVACQRFSDGVGVGSDVWIPQLGEFCAVPLSIQDGVHNGTARQPGYVTDDMIAGCRNGPADTSSFPLCPDHRPGPTLVRCDHLSTAAQGIVGNAVSVSCPIGIFAVPRINTAGVVLESPIGGWQTNNQPANPQRQDEPETAHQDIA